MDWLTKHLPFGRHTRDAWAYVHLPKCGGTAVTSLIKNKFWKHRVGMFEVRDREASIRRLNSKRFEVYTGHIGAHEILEIEAAHGIRLRKFTILRDPVGRLLSAYRHTIKRGAPAPKLSSIGRNTSDEILSGLLNTQARQVGASCTISAACADLVWDEDALTERAIAALEDYDYIGFHEQFQDSVAAVSKLLNIPCPQALPVINSTKNILVDFDEDDLAAARALTRADQRVYDTYLSRSRT